MPVYLNSPTYAKLAKVRQMLGDELGRPPTTDELAAAINVPVEQVQAVLDASPGQPT